ncbi:hypothetical protein H4219_005824 [Mycoemilia scoparia]|uniref:Retrotransposon gag domain-containing protein n=1 Tax=Mycoemilia scoparia TaxID=417184 RepID=A0A9W7ZRY9_9FUNG|nr:hypothetical protein H4219_005824 [Mycoemilia scoparia]
MIFTLFVLTMSKKTVNPLGNPDQDPLKIKEPTLADIMAAIADSHNNLHSEMNSCFEELEKNQNKLINAKITAIFGKHRLQNAGLSNDEEITPLVEEPAFVTPIPQQRIGTQQYKSLPNSPHGNWTRPPRFNLDDIQPWRTVPDENRAMLKQPQGLPTFNLKEKMTDQGRPGRASTVLEKLSLKRLLIIQDGPCGLRPNTSNGMNYDEPETFLRTFERLVESHGIDCTRWGPKWLTAKMHDDDVLSLENHAKNRKLPSDWDELKRLFLEVFTPIQDEGARLAELRKLHFNPSSNNIISFTNKFDRLCKSAGQVNNSQDILLNMFFTALPLELRCLVLNHARFRNSKGVDLDLSQSSSEDEVPLEGTSKDIVREQQPTAEELAEAARKQDALIWTFPKPPTHITPDTGSKIKGTPRAESPYDHSKEFKYKQNRNTPPLGGRDPKTRRTEEEPKYGEVFREEHEQSRLCFNFGSFTANPFAILRNIDFDLVTRAWGRRHPSFNSTPEYQIIQWIARAFRNRMLNRSSNKETELVTNVLHLLYPKKKSHRQSTKTAPPPDDDNNTDEDDE